MHANPQSLFAKNLPQSEQQTRERTKAGLKFSFC